MSNERNKENELQKSSGITDSGVSPARDEVGNGMSAMQKNLGQNIRANGEAESEPAQTSADSSVSGTDRSEQNVKQASQESRQQAKRYAALLVKARGVGITTNQGSDSWEAQYPRILKYGDKRGVIAELEYAIADTIQETTTAARFAKQEAEQPAIESRREADEAARIAKQDAEDAKLPHVSIARLPLTMHRKGDVNAMLVTMSDGEQEWGHVLVDKHGMPKWNLFLGADKVTFNSESRRTPRRKLSSAEHANGSATHTAIYFWIRGKKYL